MKRLIDRAGWALAGALGLMLMLVAARAIQAGPLDPPGSVASTMKTLDQIPGSWDRVLVANDGAPGPDPPAGCNSSRFQCGTIGVLDRETGLVWNDEPNCCVGNSWAGAKASCIGTQVSGRMGWRLPTVEELASLVQLFVGSPALPAGNPFPVLTDDAYWTATSESSTLAWTINFGTTGIPATDTKANTNYIWCVRGGQAYNGAP